MPAFGIKGIRIAKYVNENGSISYTDHTDAGAAMGANLELSFAEGRLYAKDGLHEFLRLATGGSISLAVSAILTAAQKVMYGASENTRTVGSKSVTSLRETTNDNPNYVGVAIWAPSMVNGAKKFDCVFVPKALFGAPTLTYRTREGNTITFQTPTAVGEFLPDDSSNAVIREVATVDTEADAVAWCKAVLGEQA